ncbi:hypothetical protein B0H13DRAFT_2682936 [Mycena leptocephala]|nr:hypothetical protein B0H13DRAFT_2682936 [Mycena leptocephala]
MLLLAGPKLDLTIDKRRISNNQATLTTVTSHIGKMLPGLEADRARVADLEAQILLLERSLSALQEEQILVQERLDSYKYPVLTLPNEIVSDIFMHFLPDYPPFPPLTGLLSPTLLTRICRKWREIALSTPTLWSAITSYNDGIPVKQKAHLFELWLKSSRPRPLSLQILGMDAAEILATVMPHRARWEHLVFFLPLSSLPVIDGPMPLLRHLNLSFFDAADATEVFAFCDAPLLRSVILEDVAVTSIMLPWAQLTSLTLLSVAPWECVPILQKTSNLVHCELKVYFDSDGQPGPDIPFHFLETFIVPALRSLKIPEEFLEPNPIESLARFISISGCKLEEVHITGWRSLPQDSYREKFPSILMFSFQDEEESSDSDSSDDSDSDSE